MTKKQQTAHVKLMTKARQKKMTPAQRKALAKKAARARWDKNRKAKET